MPSCCAGTIIAMTLALALGLVPSAAYAVPIGVTAGNFAAAQIAGAGPFNASVSQRSAKEDGDALLRHQPPNAGMVSATRKRKADGKESTSFIVSVSL